MSLNKLVFDRCDILVVTAQLLVNALLEHDVEINDFTLMVFDECHHAHAKHSYNQIMQSYMDQKLKNQSLRNTLPMVKYYIFSVFRLSYCHFAHPNQLLKLNSNTHSSLDHIKTEDKFSVHI